MRRRLRGVLAGVLLTRRLFFAALAAGFVLLPVEWSGLATAQPGGETYRLGPFTIGPPRTVDDSDFGWISVSLGRRTARIETRFYGDTSRESLWAQTMKAVVWQDGFLMVRGQNGGNAWREEAMHVFLEKDGRLHHLGEAMEYEGGTFYDIYDHWEFVLCHACSPALRLHLEVRFGIFVVNRQATCEQPLKESIQWPQWVRDSEAAEPLTRDWDTDRPGGWASMLYYMALVSAYCDALPAFEAALAPIVAAADPVHLSRLLEHARMRLPDRAEDEDKQRGFYYRHDVEFRDER
ncbi:MAG: hypothetical protein FJX65_08330 [Alphaproteobacteria bacterium]|nr:hypothetical protein [Alphaproteobacteria bacterium]